MNTHPAFSDVEQDIAGTRGVLDGDAFRDQERIVEKVNPQGVGFDCQVKCSHCGRPAVVTIPWPELMVAAMSVLPADMDTNLSWVAHQGYMYPPVRCGCNQPLHVPINPDKAKRFLETGLKMGCFTAQQWQQASAQVAQRAPRR